MNIKERLALFFKTYQKEISIIELLKRFKISSDELSIFENAIFELELEGKIYCCGKNKYMHKPDEFYLSHGVVRKSNKNKYYIVDTNNIINIPYGNLHGAKENDTVYLETKKGKKHQKQLDGNVVRTVTKPNIEDFKTFYKTKIKRNHSKNYYYVTIGNHDIYVPKEFLMDAYVDDEVTIQVIGRNYAKVIEVIKRNNNSQLLKCTKINGKLSFISVINNNRVIDVLIDTNEPIQENDYILVKYENDKPIFIKKVDLSSDLKENITAMLCNANYPTEFSNEALNEARNIDYNLINKEINNRKDLRNLITITIDSEDAKDLDDAISLEYIDDYYYLYVHIADVSFYVKPGSKLYEEAYERGTSIYPANYVFPMLPKELSNGICSLNPNADRLAKTCKMKFDNKGNLLDYDIFNSIINSNYKMNYKIVNDILDSNIITDEYKPYVTLLHQMNKLSNILEQRKINRGAICFDTCELKFILDEKDSIKELGNRSRGPSERIIENFMLATNEVIANYAYYLQVPFMYRNHDMPSIEQLSKLKYNLINFKKYLNYYRNLENPAVLQKVLLSIHKEMDEYASVYYSNKILSCMNRAYYCPESSGHYALALDKYATFTSPIRRFPDLFNHYIIGEILNGNIADLDKTFPNVKTMSEHASNMQQFAETFEKRVDNILLNNYLENFFDKEMESVIVFINKEFICIRTNNMLYGKIPIKRGTYKENHVRIYETPYMVGDRLVVKIDSVDELNNEIIFFPINKDIKTLKKERKNKI